MTNTELLNIIETKLEHARDDKKALGMKAYMKGQYEYYGLTAPVRKNIFKEIWKDSKNDINSKWRELVIVLWEQEQREFHYIAMDIIAKIEKKLSADDLPIIEKLISEKSWWDTVDFLASHGVGQILKSDRKLMMNTAERYINSDHMWLQRTAIIFQLFYKEKTDHELLAALIEKTIGSKEFFINKASGWALRQYSKLNPQFLIEYLDLQGGKLASLTIREASKYLNKQ